MAFPTTSVLDDFNRANAGTLGSSWTNDVRGSGDAMQVASNSALCTGAAGSAYWNVSTFGPAHEVFFTLTDRGSAQCRAYVGLSGTAANRNGYMVDSVNASLTRIYRMDGSSFTQLGADIASGLASGDSLGAELTGGNVNAYGKTGGTWSSLGSRSDSTYTTGWIGFETQGNTSQFDDFGGGTVVAGATPVFQAFQ